MGVKYNREYKDIIEDMAKTIATIPDCHHFFEMDAEDWTSLGDGEREECIRTMADDIFYGLGRTPKLEIGSGRVEYDHANHVIKVYAEAIVVHIIKLI